jgi:hypothetical protein
MAVREMVRGKVFTAYPGIQPHVFSLNQSKLIEFETESREQAARRRVK